MRRKKEVFSNKTGTGVSSVVKRNQLMGMASQPVMAKMTITYGTTVTIDLEGSKDGGVNWEQLATGTFTTGSPKYLHGAVNAKRFHQFRLNVTSNTGCTVDKGYIGIGRVED